jgi:hypothetical protein
LHVPRNRQYPEHGIMAQVGISRLRWARTLIRVGIFAAVVLAAYAGAARGQQYAPVQMPTYQQQDFNRTIEESMRQANEWNRAREWNDSRMQETLRFQELGSASKDIDGFFEKNRESLTNTLTWFAVVGLVVGGLLVLGMASGLFVRFRTTTDPMNLAMSDPWVRAQMAQFDTGAAQGALADRGVPWTPTTSGGSH